MDNSSHFYASAEHDLQSLPKFPKYFVLKATDKMIVLIAHQIDIEQNADAN